MATRKMARSNQAFPLLPAPKKAAMPKPMPAAKVMPRRMAGRKR